MKYLLLFILAPTDLLHFIFLNYLKIVQGFDIFSFKNSDTTRIAGTKICSSETWTSCVIKFSPLALCSYTEIFSGI